MHFTWSDAQEAADTWGFNCGPAVVCAVTGLMPEDIRPYLGDFEQKGFMNPTQMATCLHRLQCCFRRTQEYLGALDRDPETWTLPGYGIMRIQWAGPWTRVGVPMRARYHHTHWIACRELVTPLRYEVFDVNALLVGGWIAWEEWAEKLVPWLLRESVPKASGAFWPTHIWDIDRFWSLGKNNAESL